jgi:hypothetical protein
VSDTAAGITEAARVVKERHETCAAERFFRRHKAMIWLSKTSNQRRIRGRTLNEGGKIELEPLITLTNLHKI